MTHAQGGELRPAQAAVGQNEDGKPPVTGLVGQFVDLARGEVAASSRGDDTGRAGDADP
ncbi:MAG: hypothetical protein M3Z50_09965 [Actinomycetota bacterium]|nr:hypothetical protein [Actinomycetota bacterium]